MCVVNPKVAPKSVSEVSSSKSQKSLFPKMGLKTKGLYPKMTPKTTSLYPKMDLQTTSLE